MINIIKEQRDYFNNNKTKDIKFRIEKLKLLKTNILKYEKEIVKALKLDLNKSEFESYVTEIGLVLQELKLHIKKLPKWSKPKKVKTPIVHFISKSKIHFEPHGNILLIAPWNYPFQLVMVPLIGAISAGNAVIIKPSEYSTNTAAIVEKIIAETFDKNHVTTILGGVHETTLLLKEKFDYIFFTGSTSVGKVIYEAAAKNLTPITLELGGKSPTIVDNTANIKLAAKRIVWGKLINAGQTCIAPDYLLVHASIKEELVKEMDYYINFFYNDPLLNDDYPKIINERHFNRLINLVNKDDLIFNKDTLKIAPLIIDNISLSDKVMQEEIFGPLLPVITFNNLDDVLTIINKQPKPLALYLFTTSKKNEKLIIENISFGGGTINDTVIHFSNDKLPFGGVGLSGIGNYHGKHSFLTFSHQKGIIKKSNIIDINLRYPPFRNKIKTIKKIIK